MKIGVIWYETREQMLGGKPDEPKELIILNRRVEWAAEGLRMTSDSRHLKDLQEELGLESAKPVDTPMAVAKTESTEAHTPELSVSDGTLYRRLVAKLN